MIIILIIPTDYSLIIHAVANACVACDQLHLSLCLCAGVCVLKEKLLKLSTPKLANILSTVSSDHALLLRPKRQRSKSQDYHVTLLTY